MAIQTVSVLGCGWLGLPVAQRLVELGYRVKGATTTSEKKPLLEHKNIEAFLIHSSPEIDGDRIDQFFQSDVLFLNLPFRRTFTDPNYYKQQIGAVLNLVDLSPIRYVIFASSTSVYPQSRGRVYEDEPFEPPNERAKILTDIERMLFDRKKFQTTVLRFAGLYGANRRIGQFLAGKKAVSDGEAPVNLIHLDDCVEIVTQLIQKDIWGQVFNVCSDGHPTRKELYTQAAKHLKLPPPTFNDAEQRRYKVISNTKIKQALKYAFQHPDPLASPKL